MKQVQLILAQLELSGFTEHNIGHEAGNQPALGSLGFPIPSAEPGMGSCREISLQRRQNVTFCWMNCQQYDQNNQNRIISVIFD